MTEHTWVVETIDGGPVGDCDFWVCSRCGASAGPTVYAKRWAPFLAGPALPLSDDCDEALEQIAEHHRRPPMTPESQKLIQKAVKAAGNELHGKLPPVMGHPVRNPHAHLWKAIKDKYGKSYKECSEADVQDILQLIESCRASVP